MSVYPTRIRCLTSERSSARLLLFERNLAKCQDVMVRWRENAERRLATVDVRKFAGESIVVHFGGQLTSVDAYTFANSLISLADTVRAINAQINPGQDIDVRLDAVGPGSFKAVVKKAKTGLAGLFTGAPRNVFWIIAALYIENSLEGTSSITVSKDMVTIERGGARRSSSTRTHLMTIRELWKIQRFKSMYLEL